nr:MAG TPA: hypothetical protein [Bacteriophage sp.]
MHIYFLPMPHKTRMYALSLPDPTIGHPGKSRRHG